nr:hypothetical protein [Tanacetum cinerariifolium]
MVKLGYGVTDLTHFHFLRPKLSLDYDLHLLNVDVDVLELENVDKGPTIKETDPFDDLDEILGEYANTRKDIIGKEIIGKVDNNLTIEDVVDCDRVNETKKVGPMRNFKEVESNETADSKDLDYDPKDDEGFDDDEHILKDVHVSMNNFTFNPDTQNDLRLVEVDEHDLDVIDYDSFGSDLDDIINHERRN